MKHLLNKTKALVICLSLTIAISLAFLNHFPALAQGGPGTPLDVTKGDKCFAQSTSQGLGFLGEWDFQGNDVICVKRPINPGGEQLGIVLCKIEVPGTSGTLIQGTTTSAPPGCKAS